jgi:glycosyltransferase involved in cell wall biosynthesis
VAISLQAEIMLAEVTPLILTFNEQVNIERTLNRLAWARQIVVVDSGSTDGTLELLKAFPAVRVVYRPFDDHTSQWNFGLDQVTTSWVLSLDADYVLTQQLVEELRGMELSHSTVAYSAAFRYVLSGKALRGNLYPNRVVLFRRDACRYVNDGHTQLLQVNGAVSRLKGKIDHDDRKPLNRWLDSQRSYARLEAEHLRTQDPQTLRWPDRLRRQIWPAAPAAFLYTLLLKGCLFDGWPGWLYVLQRTYAELLLSLELLDRRLRNAERPGATPKVKANSVPSVPQDKDLK